MTDVTNNHDTALGLPDGSVIASGETKFIDSWESMRNHAVVSAWVEAGVLSSSASKDADDKESIIAQLAELGIKADKRASVEKLQEKLDEALAK